MTDLGFLDKYKLPDNLQQKWNAVGVNITNIETGAVICIYYKPHIIDGHNVLGYIYFPYRADNTKWLSEKQLNHFINKIKRYNGEEV